MTHDPYAIADLHCDVLCKLLEDPSLNTEKAERNNGPAGLEYVRPATSGTTCFRRMPST